MLVTNQVDWFFRQDGLFQVLRHNFLVKVAQISSTLDFRNERGWFALFKNRIYINISKPRVSQNLVHILLLAKSIFPVLNQHLKEVTKLPFLLLKSNPERLSKPRFRACPSRAILSARAKSGGTSDVCFGYRKAECQLSSHRLEYRVPTNRLCNHDLTQQSSRVTSTLVSRRMNSVLAANHPVQSSPIRSQQAWYSRLY